MNLIITESCVGCTRCVPYCPSGAISLGKDKKAHIDRHKCIECAVCFNNAVCPVNAFQMEELEFPRSVREVFATVYKAHKDTNVPGRGTEEMKTNDVTGRIDNGEIGFSIEIGRPGVGARLGIAEQFTIPLAKIGVEFEKASPLTAMLIDDEGHLREDIKNENVLSAIIEFKVPYEKVIDVLEIIKKLDKEADTVFSVGVISRIMKNGDIPVMDLLIDNDFSVRPNAKINVGLGRT